MNLKWGRAQSCCVFIFYLKFEICECLCFDTLNFISLAMCIEANIKDRMIIGHGTCTHLFFVRLLAVHSFSSAFVFPTQLMQSKQLTILQQQCSLIPSLNSCGNLLVVGGGWFFSAHGRFLCYSTLAYANRAVMCPSACHNECSFRILCHIHLKFIHVHTMYIASVTMWRF